VNKTIISKVPVIECPCCAAPSTTMNPVISNARSNDRHCVRCRQVLCRIDVEDSGRLLKAAMGARAK
jgi:hypothetical protein